jgi:chromosome segregation ATPase
MSQRTAMKPGLMVRSALVALGLALASSCALAEQTPAEKAARRAQLQLQNLQQQLQEAQAAKSKVEADKAAVDQQLGEQTTQAEQLKTTISKLEAKLRASEKARGELAANVKSLEKQLADEKLSHEQALAQKARELAQYTKLRDEQQAQLQRKHDDQVALVADCTSKNGKLLHLNVELLNRYRNKSVTDVIKQREPVLGMGDVEMFNMVQDYRDKADAERFTPPAAPTPNK